MRLKKVRSFRLAIHRVPASEEWFAGILRSYESQFAKYISKKERWVSNGYGGKVKKTYYKYPRRYRPRKNSIVGFLYALMKGK